MTTLLQRKQSLSLLDDMEIFPFQSKFVTIPEGEIHYVEEGEGPTMLLITGAPASLYFYKRLMMSLKTNYRLIAFDFPMVGLSQANQRFDGSLSSYAQMVSHFCEALNLRDTTMLVNDSGGPIGLYAASMMAERFQKIIITDSFAFPLNGRFLPVKWMLKFVGSAPFKLLNRKLNLLPWLVSTLAPYKRLFKRKERKLYQHFFNSEASRDSITNVFSQLAKDQSYLQDLEDRIKTHLSTMPTLILYGQLDPMNLIGAGKKLKTMFPFSTYISIAWEEHFPMLSSPEKVAKAILNWDKTDAERATPRPA